MKHIIKLGALPLLLAVTIGVSGCDDKPTDSNKPSSNTLFDSLTGSWDWKMKAGSIAYRILTPDSVGYNVTLEVTQDSFWIFSSSEPSERKKFKVRLAKDKQCTMQNNHAMEARLYDSTGTTLIDTAPFTLSNDTLRFEECGADRWEYWFTKK